MKNYFTSIIVISVCCFLLSGCLKQNKLIEQTAEDLSAYSVSYDNEVKTSGNSQGLSDYEIVDTVETSNYANYNNVDDLWETADYVVIATPTVSYADSEQHWLDSFNKPVEFDDISLAHSFCVRPFKVNKVYKGENLKLKEISVCEHVLVNGSEMKVETGSYPTQQGDKYLLFLYRSNDAEETYFPVLYQGKYNVNSEKNENQTNIDKEMYKAVKEKFKEEFK